MTQYRAVTNGAGWRVQWRFFRLWPWRFVRHYVWDFDMPREGYTAITSFKSKEEAGAYISDAVAARERAKAIRAHGWQEQ